MEKKIFFLHLFAVCLVSGLFVSKGSAQTGGGGGMLQGPAVTFTEWKAVPDGGTKDRDEELKTRVSSRVTNNEEHDTITAEVIMRMQILTENGDPTQNDDWEWVDYPNTTTPWQKKEEKDIGPKTSRKITVKWDFPVNSFMIGTYRMAYRGRAVLADDVTGITHSPSLDANGSVTWHYANPFDIEP